MSNGAVLFLDALIFWKEAAGAKRSAETNTALLEIDSGVAFGGPTFRPPSAPPLTQTGELTAEICAQWVRKRYSAGNASVCPLFKQPLCASISALTKKSVHMET